MNPTLTILVIAAAAAVLAALAVVSVSLYRAERESRRILTGVLEGVRADCIAYRRNAEALATALVQSNEYLVSLAGTRVATKGRTPGALALRQLEALNQGGAAGYYGKRDIEAMAQGAHGMAPWMPSTNGATTHTGGGNGEPPKSDPIEDAIRRRAGADMRLARHLRGVADEQLAAGSEPSDVARLVLAGEAVE